MGLQALVFVSDWNNAWLCNIDPDYHDEGGIITEMSVDIEAILTAQYSRQVLQTVMAEKDELEYEFLCLTEGFETALSDVDTMIALGTHSEEDLNKVFDEMVPQEEPCPRIAHMFGFKFKPGRTIKIPTEESFAALDANKSPRTIQKERNRRERHRIR